ncbi:MAG: hypothetical protein AB2404_15180, partial [Planifilum fimeticola]
FAVLRQIKGPKFAIRAEIHQTPPIKSVCLPRDVAIALLFRDFATVGAWIGRSAANLPLSPSFFSGFLKKEYD